MEQTQYRLLSVKEAAHLLGVSRETVRRWIYRQVIHAVRVGRNHKVPERELQKLIERHEEALP
jgi:excisionase family DNA binding protein